MIVNADDGEGRIVDGSRHDLHCERRASIRLDIDRVAMLGQMPRIRRAAYLFVMRFAGHPARNRKRRSKTVAQTLYSGDNLVVRNGAMAAGYFSARITSAPEITPIEVFRDVSHGNLKA